jgi:hypothetical protein
MGLGGCLRRLCRSRRLWGRRWLGWKRGVRLQVPGRVDTPEPLLSAALLRRWAWLAGLHPGGRVRRISDVRRQDPLLQLFFPGICIKAVLQGA